MSQQAQLQDTPAKSYRISRHGAVTKNLVEQRAMLKESTKLKSLTGPIDAFVAHYMPFMDGKDTLVNAVTQKLMKGNNRCLDQDGWIPIRKRPGLNEDETFAEMANIAEAIYRKAVEHDPALMDHRTTILECRPRQGMAAEVSGGSGLPDVMATTTKPSVPTPPEPNDGRRRSPRLQAKAKAIFYGDVNKQTRNASDAGLVGEFKLHCTPSSIEDNEGKILLGSGFILFNDPCRRFTFGFTIEDSSLRLWHFSRGHIAVSERVDFHESPEHFVRFLLFITFAPPEALGYDATVERLVKTNDEGKVEIAYRYQVGEKWYETIGKPIYEDRCLDIVTHAPRVWKVKKVLTNRNGIQRFADEINVLKDYYLYDDAKTESEIQADIFRRLSQLDQKNGAQGKLTKHGRDARPHFMTILADEPVLLGDGAIDKTPARPDGFELFHYTQTEKIAAPASVSGACRTDGRDADKDQPAGSIGSQSHLTLQPRVHQRIVFKELCDTLYTLRDFQTYVDCLASVVQGLHFLRLAGYVHRDISPGNCLYRGKQVIITDLEYAKPYEMASMHDPRTGTPEFMAVETQSRQHTFKGRLPKCDFKFNYLHDLESVLWMFVWFIFQRIPISLLPHLSSSFINQLRAQHQRLFGCGTEGSMDRLRLLQGGEHAAWTLLERLYVANTDLGFLSSDLEDLIGSFRAWYTAVESTTPVNVGGSLRWSDDVFETEYYEKLVDALLDISSKLMNAYPAGVKVKSLMEHTEDLRVAAVKSRGVEEGKSGDKRKRDGKDDGAAEKGAEVTNNGRSQKSDKKAKV